MKKTLLSLAAGGLVSLLVSNPASAALKLIVDSPTVEQPTADITQYVDVYFHETAPMDDEQMNGMFVVAYLKGTGVGATGVHFASFDAVAAQPSAAHPFIFPGQAISNFGSDATNFKVGADSPSSGAVNVTDGQGVVRLPLIIPAGTAPGTYAIAIDDDPNTPGEAGFTTFGSNDIASFPDTAAYPFTSQDGVLTVTPVPEPAALGLFSVAALGLLARRRKA
jgi:hypothetical protein